MISSISEISGNCAQDSAQFLHNSRYSSFSEKRRFARGSGREIPINFIKIESKHGKLSWETGCLFRSVFACKHRLRYSRQRAFQSLGAIQFFHSFASARSSDAFWESWEGNSNAVNWTTTLITREELKKRPSLSGAERAAAAAAQTAAPFGVPAYVVF